MAGHLTLSVALAVLLIAPTGKAIAVDAGAASTSVPRTFTRLLGEAGAPGKGGALSSLERWGLQARDLSVLTDDALLAKARPHMADGTAVAKAAQLGDAYAAYLLFLAERARLPPHAMHPANDAGMLARQYLKMSADLGLVRAISQQYFLVSQAPTLQEGKAGLEHMRKAAQTGNGFSLMLYAQVLAALAKSEADMAQAREMVWASADAGFAPAQQMRAQYKAGAAARKTAAPSGK